jgi:hypothetical protein
MLAKSVRIVLGGLVFAVGALFLTMAAVFVARVNFSGLAHPARAVGVVLVLCVLGSAIGYAGFRLVKGGNRAPTSPQL